MTAEGKHPAADGARESAERPDRDEPTHESTLLAALMDTIPDNVYFKDLQSRFTMINRAMARRFSLKEPHEAIGKTDFDFFSHEHALAAFEDEQELMRTGRPIVGKEEKETWPHHADLWVSTTKMPLYDKTGKLIGTFGISRYITERVAAEEALRKARDELEMRVKERTAALAASNQELLGEIGERKRIEAELRESEQRFRTVANFTYDWEYWIGVDGKYVYVSPSCERISGYRCEDFLNKPNLLLHITHPEDRAAMRRHARKESAKDGVFLMEHRIVTRDGQVRWVEHVCLPVRSAEGRWLGRRASNRDITDRKQAEEALRKERDKAQTYLDIAGTMIMVLDRDGKLSLINRKGCEILGYREREIIGRNWFDTILPEAQAKPVRGVFSGLMRGEIKAGEYYENTVISKSKEERLIAWHNVLLKDGEGKITGILSSGEDITQRRRTEMALRQSERLEAISALAGGVAHNFSTLFGTINGHATAIAEALLPNTRAHEDALRIADTAKHAMELTRRLTRLSRSGGPEAQRIEPVSPGQIARDMYELLSRSFAEKGIEIRLVNVEELPMVAADAGQYLDTLMHLIMNAAEAMPKGGTITIDGVERKVLRPSPRMNPDAKPGTYVSLRVRDTGIGISKDVMARVFDPFFTTKSVGPSFGLGLTVAQSMVQGWGGWIAVWSKPGHGSSFRIVAPKSAKQNGGEVAIGTPKGQTILLVDDAPECLGIMREALEHAGHLTHRCENPLAGVERYRQHADNIAVSVVDLMMPHPGGAHVVQEILKHDPQAKVIVTSGFSRDYVRGLLPVGSWAFLQKPFEPDKFMETINLLLRQRVDRNKQTQPVSR